MSVIFVQVTWAETWAELRTVTRPGCRRSSAAAPGGYGALCKPRTSVAVPKSPLKKKKQQQQQNTVQPYEGGCYKSDPTDQTIRLAKAMYAINGAHFMYGASSRVLLVSCAMSKQTPEALRSSEYMIRKETSEWKLQKALYMFSIHYVQTATLIVDQETLPPQQRKSVIKVLFFCGMKSVVRTLSPVGIQLSMTNIYNDFLVSRS